ncbi:MAG: sulfite exporter TauE/SafE family protein [Flavobacteriales bacterium]
MQIFAWISALLIGLSLGLIGGGGSTLTLPVMTYMMGLDKYTATSYSLFIVGISALFGAFRKYQVGDLDFKIGLLFGIPAAISLSLTRSFISPYLPPLFVMLFFACIMLLASYSMIKGRKDTEGEENSEPTNYIFLMLMSVVVGVIAGMVGAGGGFLIIPALVFFFKTPMKRAVGTSLFIISMQTLFGFSTDVLQGEINIDWNILLPFSTLAVIGILLGTYLTKFISAKNLKSGFGYFILIMAIFILAKELILK